MGIADRKPSTATDERRWEAVQRRDASLQPAFFYGVVTTGIYCRPACGARLPLRANVRFYATAAEAEADGLRACKRCKPNVPQETPAAIAGVRRVCALLKAHTGPPIAAEQLAAEAALSTAHFQRTFQHLLGVTPKQYADRLRLRRLKAGLRKGETVTTNLHAHGFNSSSRIYRRSNTSLGMTPAQYSKGGAGATFHYTSVRSRLGRMMLAATERGLCSIQFGDADEALQALLAAEYPQATLLPAPQPHHPHLALWIEALHRYLAGTATSLALPVDVRATAFELRVWNFLQGIPYGQTRSYAQVATELGQPQAVRAVASACARNQVALLIPCHRVLRSDGSLGGFRWGLDRKRSLLALEAETTVAAGQGLFLKP